MAVAGHAVAVCLHWRQQPPLISEATNLRLSPHQPRFPLQPHLRQSPTPTFSPAQKVPHPSFGQLILLFSLLSTL